MWRSPQTLSRLGKFVRDAWLILGLSVALFVSLELAYRAQGAVRKHISSASGAVPEHPQADNPWFEEYVREWEATYKLRWRPYVYFRRVPFKGRYINVDEHGLRRTIHPVSAGDGANPIFLFGGSTVFGSTHRDSATIASLLARALAESSLTQYRVFNFGETGYVFTQEVLELLIQLRNGARPRLVVFYDGINDVAAAAQSGVAGITLNEQNRAREFRLGRAIFTWERGITAESRAFRALVEISIHRSQLVQRLLRLTRQQTWESAPPEELAAQVVEAYVNTATLVEALADDYGFRAIYVWQPTLHITTKSLTTYEQFLMREINADGYQATLKAVHALVREPLESAMVGVAPGRFLNLSDLFASDTTDVFVDTIGHTTEEANVSIANALLPSLVQQLSDLPSAR